MLFILMLKMIIILSQTQRLKYYMHVFFIELTILVFTGVFDIIGQQSVIYNLFRSQKDGR